MSSDSQDRIQVYAKKRLTKRFDEAWKSRNRESRSATIQELMQAYVDTKGDTIKAVGRAIAKGERIRQDGLLD